MKTLWLSHNLPPLLTEFSDDYRAGLLESMRRGLLASMTETSPLRFSQLLEEAIDEDPHLSSFKTATLIEPVLFFPCSDGLLVSGGLAGGICPYHGDQLISPSFTSLPKERMPKEFVEPWKKLRDPELSIQHCMRAFQRTGPIFGAFYLNEMNHKHED